LISAATAGKSGESRVVQISGKLIINPTWSLLIIVFCPFILKKKDGSRLGTVTKSVTS
jgi:hypothetical protein